MTPKRCANLSALFELRRIYLSRFGNPPLFKIILKNGQELSGLRNITFFSIEDGGCGAMKSVILEVVDLEGRTFRLCWAPVATGEHIVGRVEVEWINSGSRRPKLSELEVQAIIRLLPPGSFSAEEIAREIGINRILHEADFDQNRERRK